MKESGHIIGMRHSDLHGVLGTSCMGMQKYTIEMNNFKNHRTNQNTDLIAELTAKINDWKKLAGKKQGVFIITDAIQANQFLSTLPDYATVQITTYFINKKHGEWIDQQVKKIARKGSRDRLQVRVQTLGGRAPVINSPANQVFYTEIQKIAQQIEITIDAVHFDTTSDIAFAGDEVPAIEGLGPLGNNCGSPDEFIIRDSLIDRAALLAMILYHGSSK
jgi:acetylornithine deacetylase/succinyl-diaminopimelate desuccinylase-like protein